ncbi:MULTISPECIES: MFS transporter [unclassified Lentilitoribacter]|jgi:NNP family nitrate/nitrite transporter-like MFS transporter|uniref:MFS transporter n=1 Tax=unclassified Lentilitoribacter TaxID=2647570 RepID=UPI0013A688E5|nr:MFS transporter [Lentilitoribacter sp. Alg239-R112]
MELQNKATSLWGNFFKISMVQIRTFHMTWFAFFLCFFAWFGIAPLMKVVRDELSLTKDQIGWIIIASVSVTIFARLLIGWLCDRIGPRLTYTGLLTLGAFPVMGIGLAQDFETFLIFRLMIGAIGASFVITQYHTSVMFAPNVVGQANATSAGWGNLGGGVTQLAMPMIFSVFVIGFGFSEALGWRLSMVVVGAAIFVTGIAYYFLTQDAPDGNFKELRAKGMMPEKKKVTGDYFEALKDSRVWVLFLIYGACFGIELTVNNVAALYFADYFDLGLITAGLVAASFGLMNIFARTLGGIFGDNYGAIWGLKGRAFWLFICLFCEGLALMLFSQMQVLFLAIPALILFSLFTQMAEGATYSVVPFINKKALGAVAGVVGAGGNAGAVAAGFLFKGTLNWSEAFFIIGVVVTIASFLAFFVRFSTKQEDEERANFAAANIDVIRAKAAKANADLELAMQSIAKKTT